MVGLLVVAGMLKQALAHPKVKYVVTVPGLGGAVLLSRRHLLCPYAHGSGYH